MKRVYFNVGPFFGGLAVAVVMLLFAGGLLWVGEQIMAVLAGTVALVLFGLLFSVPTRLDFSETGFTVSRLLTKTRISLGDIRSVNTDRVGGLTSTRIKLIYRIVWEDANGKKKFLGVPVNETTREWMETYCGGPIR